MCNLVLDTHVTPESPYTIWSVLVTLSGSLSKQKGIIAALTSDQ